jgi:DNA-binding NtrC family response regulator
MLSISADREDHDILAKIVDQAAWQFVAANTCREAMSRLNRMRIAVILCEYSLEDGTWKDVLDHLTRTGKAAPLVVTSRRADEHLWAEVLNLGGYDVLAKPFRAREVVHAITSALLHGVRSVPRVRAAGG